MNPTPSHPVRLPRRYFHGSNKPKLMRLIEVAQSAYAGSRKLASNLNYDFRIVGHSMAAGPCLLQLPVESGDEGVPVHAKRGDGCMMAMEILKARIAASLSASSVANVSKGGTRR